MIMGTDKHGQKTDVDERERRNIRRLRDAAAVLEGFEAGGPGFSEAEYIEVQYLIWRAIDIIRG